MARCTALNDDFMRCTRVEGHEGEHRAGSRGATLRNFRAKDPLWDGAKATARGRGEELGAVLRAALEWYQREPERIMPPPAD